MNKKGNSYARVTLPPSDLEGVTQIWGSGWSSSNGRAVVRPMVVATTEIGFWGCQGATGRLGLEASMGEGGGPMAGGDVIARAPL
jgi:hypothetical protein